MHRPHAQTDTLESPRSNFFEGVNASVFMEHERVLRSSAFSRFSQELAYYEADKAYLTVEKCAQRCCFLSALLTAAVLDARQRRAAGGKLTT